VVLAKALALAGTVVCEPMASARLEVPAGRIGAVLSALTRLGAAVDAPQPQGDLSVLETVLPAASVHLLQQQLPGLTGGEGVLESSFAGYQPVHGAPPVRKTPAG
jgi:ribosomal protection tetracycline resistance protein